MTEDRKAVDNEEAVTERLMYALETFDGEPRSRSRAVQLLEALELNGLELRLIDE